MSCMITPWIHGTKEFFDTVNPFKSSSPPIVVTRADLINNKYPVKRKNST